MFDKLRKMLDADKRSYEEIIKREQLKQMIGRLEATIQFPPSPILGQMYHDGNQLFIWTGATWVPTSQGQSMNVFGIKSGIAGPTGVVGSTGPIDSISWRSSEPILTHIHYCCNLDLIENSELKLEVLEDSELDIEIKHFVQDTIESVYQAVTGSKRLAKEIFTGTILHHLSELLTKQLKSEVKFLEVVEHFDPFAFQGTKTIEKHLTFKLQLSQKLIESYPSRNNQKLKDLLDQAFPI